VNLKGKGVMLWLMMLVPFCPPRVGRGVEVVS